MKYYLAAVILLISCGLFAQNGSGEYKIKQIIPVSGNGGWDYLTVDNASMRIFLSHSTCVQVIDLKSGKQVGVIPNTPGVHGIALAHEFNKGFISAGKIDSVIVFDLKSYRILGKIPAGRNPDAILYDPFSQQVFAFNARGNSVTVIKAENDSVVATVKLRGNPEFAVTDISGNIYVNLENIGFIARIDAKSLQIIGMYPIGPDKEPTGLALDKQNNLLFSGCSGTNELTVLNISSGEVVATLPIGMHCDGVTFMPAQNDIFTSNGEGTITVIHQNAPDRYTKAQTLVTKRGARTISCNYSSQNIYTITAEFDDVKKEYKPDSFQLIVVGK
ncbi:MAG: YncE family protein [Bacteroidetes bacterium]|nr:YncE family protein [Bacteroidota bacterium]